MNSSRNNLTIHKCHLLVEGKRKSQLHIDCTWYGKASGVWREGTGLQSAAHSIQGGTPNYEPFSVQRLCWCNKQTHTHTRTHSHPCTHVRVLALSNTAIFPAESTDRSGPGGKSACRDSRISLGMPVLHCAARLLYRSKLAAPEWKEALALIGSQH